MTNYTLNDDQLTVLNQIAEDLGRNAQALIDLVQSIREGGADEQALQAARVANQAIDANNALQQRARQGDDVTDREVQDVERQLAEADQSVEAQLQSLRETVTEHDSHLQRIDEILGMGENGSTRLDVHRGGTEAPRRELRRHAQGARRRRRQPRLDLGRRQPERRLVVVENRGVNNSWQPRLLLGAGLGLITFLVMWVLFSVFSDSLGWETAWVPALMLGLVAFVAGLFLTNNNRNNS